MQQQEAANNVNEETTSVEMMRIMGLVTLGSMKVSSEKTGMEECLALPGRQAGEFILWVAHKPVCRDRELRPGSTKRRKERR